MLGIVGILDDVTKAVPASFQKVGSKVLLLQSTTETQGSERRELGSSDYAKTNHSTLWGTPPWIDIKSEAALHKALQQLASKGLIHSAKDVSDGGLAVALAESCFRHNLGVHVNLGALDAEGALTALFGENASEVIITCAQEDYGEICLLLDRDGAYWPLDLGETIPLRVEIFADDEELIGESTSALKSIWAGSLEAQFAEEVFA